MHGMLSSFEEEGVTISASSPNFHLALKMLSSSAGCQPLAGNIIPNIITHTSHHFLNQLFYKSPVACFTLKTHLLVQRSARTQPTPTASFENDLCQVTHSVYSEPMPLLQKYYSFHLGSVSV